MKAHKRRRPYVPPELDALFRAKSIKRMIFLNEDGEPETIPLNQRERGRPTHWEADFATWSNAVLVWVQNPDLPSLRSLLLKITEEESEIRRMERSIARLGVRFIGVVVDLTVSPPAIIASSQTIFPLLHFQPLGLRIRVDNPWYANSRRPSSRYPGARLASAITIGGLQAESIDAAREGALRIDAAQREAKTNGGAFVLVLASDGLQIRQLPKFLTYKLPADLMS